MAVLRAALLISAALACACTAYAQAPAVHGFVRASDGVLIHVLEQGSGTPVVLLHGMTGSAASNYGQTGLIERLARTHRVVAIDFRGHGKSGRPLEPDAYQPDRLVRDVLEVLDARQLERAHFVGYSAGGWTIRRLISAAPERVLSATLGGDGPFDGGWRSLGSEDPKGYDPAPPRGASAMWNDDRNNAAYRAFGEGLSKPGSYSDRPDFASHAIPILQIQGQFDYPNTMSRLLRRNVRDYRLIVLPGRTHLTALADPGFTAAVSTFLHERDRIAVQGPAQPAAAP